jgi:hypothetical protein
MRAEREAQRGSGDDAEADRRTDLDAPVAAQPPYLVT